MESKYVLDPSLYDEWIMCQYRKEVAECVLSLIENLFRLCSNQEKPGSVNQTLADIIETVGNSFPSIKRVGFYQVDQNRNIVDRLSKPNQPDDQQETTILSMGKRAMDDKEKHSMIDPETKSVSCVQPISANGHVLGFIWIYDNYNSEKNGEACSLTVEGNSQDKADEDCDTPKSMLDFLIDEVYKPITMLLSYHQLLPEKFDDRSFMYSFTRISTQELVKINNKIDVILDHVASKTKSC